MNFKFKTNNELSNLENTNCTTIQEVAELTSSLNREIYLNAITPTEIDNICKIIQLWNRIDEQNNINFSARKPIIIYIDSQGGVLSSTFTLMDCIKLSKTPVYTVNIGLAHKEAFYIFLQGHKRYSYPRASFLIEKSIQQFTEDDIQSNYQYFCEKQLVELKDLVLEKTKVSENDYLDRNRWWIDADKAFELKICNEILRTSLRP